MRMFGCQDECEGKMACRVWCENAERCLMVELPYDVREHTDENCWCNPTLDFTDPDTGVQVWVHNHPQ